jgi:gluconate kinase
MGARFDGWIPIRVFLRGNEARVDWCHFGRKRFDRPFFKDSVDEALRLPFNQAFRRETSIDALAEWNAASPGIAPTAFLHHASRCGSTLLARMLAALDSHVVMSEPPMVDAVLGARRMSPGVTEDMQVLWLRGLVSALAQPRNGESAFFVKLDAWHILDLALLRKAFPRTPWLYLYRDPVEIAVSQMRQRGGFMIPGVFGPGMMLFGAEQSMAMAPEEFVVRVLGRMLEAGAAGCAADGGIPIHYSELPQAAWTRLRDVLGIDRSDRTLEALQSAARWDAKNPHFEFVNDSTRKQREASASMRELAGRWATPAYLELEALRGAAGAAVAGPGQAARYAAPAAP